MSDFMGGHDDIQGHVYMHNGIFLRWAVVDELGICLVHLFITQEGMNKDSQYKIVYLSPALKDRSSGADRHVPLTFCEFS
jgi:hypothetical protein